MSAELLRYVRELVAELPFTLNLPDGAYPIATNAGVYELHLTNNLLFVGWPDGQWAFGTESDLTANLGERCRTAFRRPLRTVVRRRDEVEARPADLPPADETQLLANLSHHMRQGQPEFPGGSAELAASARGQYDALSEEQRAELEFDTRVRLHEQAPFGDHCERFLDGLNRLIRRYAVHFDDRFVYPVAEPHFADSLLGGIRVTHWVNGHELSSTRHVGGLFAYILRCPWFTHPNDLIAGFRQALTSDCTVSPVGLLAVRARSCLLRGEWRAAVIEAAAALDLSITRQLQAGFRRVGRSEDEIARLLREPRFNVRCTDRMREARNRSVADLNPALWDVVVGTHRPLRNRVTHADHEPTSQEAEAAVGAMVELAAAVERMT
jgi:hypothetical protein